MNLSNILAPWLGNQQQLYTPDLKTTNNDASLGTGGFAKGAYRVANGVLNLQWYWFFGTGGTPGTGDIIVPLPPGFSKDSIDLDHMISASGTPAVLVICNGSVNGSASAFDCGAVAPPGSPFIFSVNPISTGVIPGDNVGYVVDFPLK